MKLDIAALVAHKKAQQLEGKINEGTVVTANGTNHNASDEAWDLGLVHNVWNEGLVVPHDRKDVDTNKRIRFAQAAGFEAQTVLAGSFNVMLTTHFWQQSLGRKFLDVNTGEVQSLTLELIEAAVLWGRKNVAKPHFDARDGVWKRVYVRLWNFQTDTYFVIDPWRDQDSGQYKAAHYSASVVSAMFNDVEGDPSDIVSERNQHAIRKAQAGHTKEADINVVLSVEDLM